ncbi:hypothetical protein NQ315_017149 [Exocentrus adspersus]|uniref:Uncharacterized protein n=1 Tax=Exocentrus adspersus TaxID=1586481 RepID=A0AAV8VCP6_9CUCU|nr:hypothetical protein NQ315_017149 [Exocentrus adspersus]
MISMLRSIEIIAEDANKVFKADKDSDKKGKPNCHGKNINDKELVAEQQKTENLFCNQPGKRKHKPNNQDGWTNVKHKRSNKKRNIVIGSNKNTPVTISAVPRIVWLHVCRLDPQTTEANLREALVANFPEIICEKIESRYPDLYSSFKVSILEKHFDKSMCPDMWPEGACISKFFMRRRRINPEK